LNKCEAANNKVSCQYGSVADYSSEGGIRNYLAAHKQTLSDILNMDQSYVFFNASRNGPFGAEGIPIAAHHSLATDLSLIPNGTVVMFNTNRPGATAGNCKSISTMAVSQDSGGAIGGAHADWYMGDDQEAKSLAGDFNWPGTLFVALPHGAGQPIPNCQ
jgi:membrane-bound lytic murein transglycosylase A